MAELNEGVKDAYNFIKDHMQLTDKGGATVKQSDFMEYMKEQGFNKEVMANLGAVQGNWINAQQVHAGELLCKKVEEVKKAGGDVKDVQVEFKTAVPDGCIRTTLKSYKQSANPSDRTKIVEHYGRGSMVFEQSRKLDPNILAEIEEDVAKLIK
jgi:hypothetical protein